MVKAAIVTGEDTNKAYKISEVELGSLGDDEILVETKAVAINPVDLLNLKTPGASAGSDGAGVVIEVGKNVEGYKKGDYLTGSVYAHNERMGTFRSKFIARPNNSINVTQLIKDIAPLSPGEHESSGLTTFEAAASVPCGLITAATILSDSLKVDTNKEHNKGKYILIWGGATASGVIVTQLAKAIYGLNVIVTASTNAKLLKSLGADHVVNYKDSDAVEQVKELVNGNIAYALDCIGKPETFQATYDATVGSETLAIDNLQFLQPDAIKVDNSRNIKYGQTAGFVAMGYEVFNMKPTPEQIVNFDTFWYDLLPPHISSLKTANLIVLEQGLESLNEGVLLVKEHRVHGSKVVVRV